MLKLSTFKGLHVTLSASAKGNYDPRDLSSAEMKEKLDLKRTHVTFERLSRDGGNLHYYPNERHGDKGNDGNVPAFDADGKDIGTFSADPA